MSRASGISVQYSEDFLPSKRSVIDDSLSMLENGDADEDSDRNISIDSLSRAGSGRGWNKGDNSDEQIDTSNSTLGNGRQKQANGHTNIAFAKDMVIDLATGKVADKGRKLHIKSQRSSSISANSDSFFDHPKKKNVFFDLSGASLPADTPGERPSLGALAGNRKKFGFSINSDDNSAMENEMSNWLKAKQGVSRLSTFRDGLMMQKGVWIKSNWFEYVGYTLFAIIIQLALGLSGKAIFPDDQKSCVKKDGKDEMYNQSICELLKTVDKSAENFKVLAAFILGGFVLSSVNIWTERRMRYRSLNGAIRSLLLVLFAKIPVDETDDQLCFDRAIISRWCVLGYECAILEARGQMDTDDGRAYLEALNLLSSDEWDKMIPGDRMTSAWSWILLKCKRLSLDGYIEPGDLMCITESITNMRDNGMNLVAQEFSDLAPPYVFTCAFLVNINVFLQTLADGIQWAIWLHDDKEVWKQPKMYFSVFFLLFYTTIFALLYDLCSALHNPFGPRDFLDLPHHRIGAQVRGLAKDLAAADNPSTMTYKQIGPLRKVNTDVSGDLSIRKMDNRMARLSTVMKTNFLQPGGMVKYHKKIEQRSERNLRIRNSTVDTYDPNYNNYDSYDRD